MRVSIERITYFVVIANTDRTEGRGQQVVLGNYATREAAEAAAKGQGVWLGDADVEERTEAVLCADDGTLYRLGAQLVIAGWGQ